MLTSPLPVTTEFAATTCSGGVAEYVYGREDREFGDLGRSLGDEIQRRVTIGSLPRPLLEPDQCIRATVIGASQFTVQVSGSTITVSDANLLPIHNLPVVFPPLILGARPNSKAIAFATRATLAASGLERRAGGLALAIRWSGSPVYERLKAVAVGIVGGVKDFVADGATLVLVFDADVGQVIGEVIRRELDSKISLVALDGLQLADFDFLDIGEPLEPPGVVPVVVKSLLFADAVETSTVGN
jgi:ethanolamine utilization protein EutA